MGGYVGKGQDRVSADLDFRYAPIDRPRANVFLNGRFAVWQRGDSFTATPTATYTADRWVVAAAGANLTVSKGTQANSNRPFMNVIGAAGNTFAWVAQRVINSNASDMTYGPAAASFELYNNGPVPVTVAINCHRANSSNDFSSLTLVETGDQVEIPPNTLMVVSQVFGALPPEVSNGIQLSLNFVNGIPSGNNVGIYRAKFEKGDKATAFEYIDEESNFQACQAYYQIRNFPIWAFQYTGSAGGSQLLQFVSFAIKMVRIPTPAIKVAPVYDNCSDVQFAANALELMLHVTVTAPGWYRAYSGTYELDAEI